MYRLAGTRPLRGEIFEDTAPTIHPAAETADAAAVPSFVLAAAPVQMTQATQQVSAAHASSQEYVIELSDSSSQSFKCKEDMSCSSSRLAHAADQQEPDKRTSARVTKTPKRFLDGIPLAADGNERYAMLLCASFPNKPVPEKSMKSVKQCIIQATCTQEQPGAFSSPHTKSICAPVLNGNKFFGLCTGQETYSDKLDKGRWMSLTSTFKRLFLPLLYTLLLIPNK